MLSNLKLDKLRYHEMQFGRLMSLRIYSWLLNIKKFNRLHESFGMSFMLFVSDLGFLQLYYWLRTFPEATSSYFLNNMSILLHFFYFEYYNRTCLLFAQFYTWKA